MESIYDCDVTGSNQTCSLVNSSLLPSGDHEIIDQVVYGYIVPPICMIGVLCNIVNLVVLTNKNLSQSPFVYLTGLAISDMLTLILFFLSGFSRGHYQHNRDWKVYEYQVYFTVGSMATKVSGLLTVALTIERYIFVTFPVRASTICTPSNARKVTLGVYLFSIIYNTPRFFAFKTNDDLSLGFTEFGASQFFKTFVWIQLIVLSIGMCLVLTILNILLIRYVMSSNRQRRGAAQNISNFYRIRDNNRLTKMLIAIICLYIIGNIPATFISRAIFSEIFGKEATETTSYYISKLVATLIVVLEHSLNFVVYCIFNRKFRAILLSYLARLHIISQKASPPIQSSDAAKQSILLTKSIHAENGTTLASSSEERLNHARINDYDV